MFKTADGDFTVVMPNYFLTGHSGLTLTPLFFPWF